MLAYEDDPLTRDYLRFYKMDAGPVYTFYRPFHLGPLETVQTVARAVLLQDAAAAPAGPPVTEVIAQAKRPLTAGSTLDGIGGFMAYGMIENASTARAERLLPMGLTDGAVLTRDVAEDAALTFDDVRLPDDRVSIPLWFEQARRFGLAVPGSDEPGAS